MIVSLVFISSQEHGEKQCQFCIVISVNYMVDLFKGI